MFVYHRITHDENYYVDRHGKVRPYDCDVDDSTDDQQFFRTAISQHFSVHDNIMNYFDIIPCFDETLSSKMGWFSRQDGEGCFPFVPDNFCDIALREIDNLGTHLKAPHLFLKSYKSKEEQLLDFMSLGSQDYVCFDREFLKKYGKRFKELLK